MEIIRMSGCSSFDNRTKSSCQDCSTTIINSNSIRPRAIRNGYSTARRCPASTNLFNTNKRTCTVVDVRVSSRETGLVSNRHETTNVVYEVNDTCVDSCSSCNSSIVATPSITAFNSFRAVLAEVPCIRCRGCKEASIVCGCSSVLTASDNSTIV